MTDTFVRNASEEERNGGVYGKIAKRAFSKVRAMQQEMQLQEKAELF